MVSLKLSTSLFAYSTTKSNLPFKQLIISHVKRRSPLFHKLNRVFSQMGVSLNSWLICNNFIPSDNWKKSESSWHHPDFYRDYNFAASADEDNWCLSCERGFCRSHGIDYLSDDGSDYWRDCGEFYDSD